MTARGVPPLRCEPQRAGLGGRLSLAHPQGSRREGWGHQDGLGRGLAELLRHRSAAGDECRGASSIPGVGDTQYQDTEDGVDFAYDLEMETPLRLPAWARTASSPSTASCGTCSTRTTTPATTESPQPPRHLEPAGCGRRHDPLRRRSGADRRQAAEGGGTDRLYTGRTQRRPHCFGAAQQARGLVPAAALLLAAQRRWPVLPPQLLQRRVLRLHLHYPAVRLPNSTG